MPYLPTALYHLFRTESVLFLGCSLNQDRYLRILKQSDTSTTHFAIVPFDSTDPRFAQLEQYHIRPIVYKPANRHLGLQYIFEFLLDKRKVVSKASVSIDVSTSCELLRLTEKYFSRNQYGLPQFSSTRFWKALQFINDGARLDLIISDGALLLSSKPKLKLAASTADFETVNLSLPPDGNTRFEFLPAPYALSVVCEGSHPNYSIILHDPSFNFTIVFNIRPQSNF